MTRKDYNLIARSLRESLVATTHNDQAVGIIKATKALASTLAHDNSRFDPDRFVDAVLEGKRI